MELVQRFGDEYRISQDLVYRIYIQIGLFFMNDQQGLSSDRLRSLQNIIDQVVNKNLLVENLKDWYQKISPYDYEALGFISEAIVSMSTDCPTFKKDILILEILNSYTRNHLPNRDEVERNREQDHNELGLPVIPTGWHSSWSKCLQLQSMRIDFHNLKKEPLQTLASELNEENLTRLIPLVQVLNVSADYFYEYIINKKLEDSVALRLTRNFLTKGCRSLKLRVGFQESKRMKQPLG